MEDMLLAIVLATDEPVVEMELCPTFLFTADAMLLPTFPLANDLVSEFSFEFDHKLPEQVGSK